MERLRQLGRLWMRFGHFMGDLFGRLVLTIFYFTIFLPFGLGMRLLGDPLNLRPARPDWLARSTHDRKLEDARRLT